jgi:hypothetical protein
VEAVESWCKSLMMRESTFAGEMRHDLLRNDDSLYPAADRRCQALDGAAKGILGDGKMPF